MRILVDADACPVKQSIIDLAVPRNVPIIMVASIAHDLPDVPGVEAVRVDRDSQAADIAIANKARRGDLVITGDYGLACLVLAKGARALGFRGQPFTKDNIDTLLAARHIAARARRGGFFARGPKRMGSEEIQQFRQALEAALEADVAPPA